MRFGDVLYQDEFSRAMVWIVNSMAKPNKPLVNNSYRLCTKEANEITIIIIIIIIIIIMIIRIRIITIFMSQLKMPEGNIPLLTGHTYNLRQ